MMIIKEFRIIITKKFKIKLIDQSFDIKNVLDKVKKNLYNVMCYYWRFLPEDYLLSTILDPRVKHIYNKEEE